MKKFIEIEREIEKAQKERSEADGAHIYYLAWFWDGYEKGLKNALNIILEEADAE